MALPKILETENEKVVINLSILAIPEFNDLWETSQSLEVFQYLWAMYDPESPYMNLDESDREDAILKDFPVHHFLNTQEMIDAIEKCEKLYLSPIRKILTGTKAGVERLAEYFRTTEIDHGRDGNLTGIINGIKGMPQILRAYQEAELAYKQEVQKSRGNISGGVDEDYDSDYDD